MARVFGWRRYPGVVEGFYLFDVGFVLSGVGVYGFAVGYQVLPFDLLEVGAGLYGSGRGPLDVFTLFVLLVHHVLFVPRCPALRQPLLKALAQARVKRSHFPAQEIVD